MQNIDTFIIISNNFIDIIREPVTKILPLHHGASHNYHNVFGRGFLHGSLLRYTLFINFKQSKKLCVDNGSMRVFVSDCVNGKKTVIGLLSIFNQQYSQIILP